MSARTLINATLRDIRYWSRKKNTAASSEDRQYARAEEIMAREYLEMLKGEINEISR